MLRRLTAARAAKNRVRALPSARFFSATFGAGVVATQRPITCPKRHIQPERYATLGLQLGRKIFMKNDQKCSLRK